MKKGIIIGSLFLVFLLILLPAIPAIEFNTIVESNKSYLIEKIQSIDTEELTERFWKPGKFLAILSAFLIVLYLKLNETYERKFPLLLLLIITVYIILLILALLSIGDLSP